MFLTCVPWNAPKYHFFKSYIYLILALFKDEGLVKYLIQFLNVIIWSQCSLKCEPKYRSQKLASTHLPPLHAFHRPNVWCVSLWKVSTGLPRYLCKLCSLNLQIKNTEIGNVRSAKNTNNTLFLLTENWKKWILWQQITRVTWSQNFPFLVH
jgi:hypothetical protein